jgi:hypothetical protein
MSHFCDHAGRPTVFKIKTSKEYRKRKKAYCGIYNIVNTTERADLSPSERFRAPGFHVDPYLDSRAKGQARARQILNQPGRVEAGIVCDYSLETFT